MLLEQLYREPIARSPAAANRQHYQLPPEFFRLVLGQHLKYSCCYWPPGVETLTAAEAAALAQAAARAQIEDGMKVLDLGCGWGSLALWVAERNPGCRVTAISNSAAQGELIRRRARRRGLGNVVVATADVNDFDAGDTFDRIVSIEMFEHVRNQAALLERVSGWLAPGGRLFVHVFCHRRHPYVFEDEGAGDWMARHFFTGGLMPSERLMEELGGPLTPVGRWRLSGQHYRATARAWLANLDSHRAEILEILAGVHGASARRWLGRWRLFFLACAELFGYRDGREWFVSQTLWRRGRTATDRSRGA